MLNTLLVEKCVVSDTNVCWFVEITSQVASAPNLCPKVYDAPKVISSLEETLWVNCNPKSSL